MTWSENALIYIFVGFNDENVFPYPSENSTGFSQTVTVAATSTSVIEVVESAICNDVTNTIQGGIIR